MRFEVLMPLPTSLRAAPGSLSPPRWMCLSRAGGKLQLCLGSRTSWIIYCWSPVKSLQADLEGTCRWRARKTGSAFQRVGNWKETFCTWPKRVRFTPRKIWPLVPQGISRDFFLISEKLSRSSSDTKHGTIFQCSSSSSLRGQKPDLGNASAARVMAGCSLSQLGLALGEATRASGPQLPTMGSSTSRPGRVQIQTLWMDWGRVSRLILDRKSFGELGKALEPIRCLLTFQVLPCTLFLGSTVQVTNSQPRKSYKVRSRNLDLHKSLTLKYPGTQLTVCCNTKGNGEDYGSRVKHFSA